MPPGCWRTPWVRNPKPGPRRTRGRLVVDGIGHGQHFAPHRAGRLALTGGIEGHRQLVGGTVVGGGVRQHLRKEAGGRGAIVAGVKGMQARPHQLLVAAERRQTEPRTGLRDSGGIVAMVR